MQFVQEVHFFLLPSIHKYVVAYDLEISVLNHDLVSQDLFHINYTSAE